VAVGMQVGGATGAERPPAVVRQPQIDAQQIDARGVVRLHADLAEVERPRRERREPHPAIAAVVAAEHATGAGAVVESRHPPTGIRLDRKSTRLNSSHEWISYAVFC